MSGLRDDAYTIPTSNDTYNLTITGDSLDAAIYNTVQVNSANVKVDVVKAVTLIQVVNR